MHLPNIDGSYRYNPIRLATEATCTSATIVSAMFFDKGLIGFDVAVVSSDRATGVAQTPKRGTQRHGNSRVALAA